MSVIRRVPGAVGVRPARVMATSPAQGLAAETGFGVGANDAVYFAAWLRRDSAASGFYLQFYTNGTTAGRSIRCVTGDTISVQHADASNSSNRADSAAGAFPVSVNYLPIIGEFAASNSRRIITNGTIVSNSASRPLSTAPDRLILSSGSHAYGIAQLAIFSGTASSSLIDLHRRGVHPTLLPGQLIECWDLDRVGPIRGLVRGTVLTPTGGGSLTPGPANLQGPPVTRRLYVDLGATGTPADTSLVAALTARGTLSGTLTTSISAAASLAVRGSTAASLTTSIAPAAALTGAASLAGSLTTAIAPTATLTARGTTTGALTTALPLASALGVRGTVTADLTAGSATLGTATLTGRGSLTGTLTTGLPLATALTGRATLTGDLTTPSTAWAAALTARTTLTASLTTAIRPAAALVGQGTLSGALQTAVPLAAATTGRGTLTAALTTQLALDAGLQARGTLAGGLSTQIRLAGAATGVGTLRADLTVTPVVVPDVIVMGEITLGEVVRVGPITVAEGITMGAITVTEDLQIGSVTVRGQA